MISIVNKYKSTHFISNETLSPVSPQLHWTLFNLNLIKYLFKVPIHISSQRSKHK